MAIFPNKNTLKLLRIPFSFFLMPIFILALSQTASVNLHLACLSFLIVHFLVYPASNGYNSYIDRDETSIGGLENPPLPTKQLFYVTLILDVFAVLASALFVHLYFSICILIYILVSRAYSSKQIRLKKYPYLGFLTVIFFQGAFTYFMFSVGISNKTFQFSTAHILLLCACSLQIAGAYPLTQIYQFTEDAKSGVITISYKLGYKGTFFFTAFMFALCNIFYYLYFNQTNHLNQFYILQLFFLPIVLYFLSWFLKVLKNPLDANFKNTMKMNFIAAICMNSCFIVLYFVNR